MPLGLVKPVPYLMRACLFHPEPSRPAWTRSISGRWLHQILDQNRDHGFKFQSKHLNSCSFLLDVASLFNNKNVFLQEKLGEAKILKNPFSSLQKRIMASSRPKENGFHHQVKGLTFQFNFYPHEWNVIEIVKNMVAFNQWPLDEQASGQTCLKDFLFFSHQCKLVYYWKKILSRIRMK